MKFFPSEAGAFEPVRPAAVAAKPGASVPQQAAAKGVSSMAGAALKADAVVASVPGLKQGAGEVVGQSVNGHGLPTSGGQRRGVEHGVLDRASGQPSVDTKGLTGRGAQRRLRDARAEVDRIHREMQLMVERTLEVPGHAIRLCVHRRAAFEQLSLRWRLSHGTRAHLSWGEVAERIAGYPQALMLWYQQANLLTQQLNAKEREARAMLRKAREDLAGLEGELGQLI